MNYETLWSIHDLPSATSSTTVLLWIVGISALLFGLTFYFKHYLIKANFDLNVIRFGLISFLILGLTGGIYIVFFSDINEYEEREKIIRSGLTIEGQVHTHKISYRNTRMGSVQNEYFKIDTVAFSFSDELLQRFNTFSEINSNYIRNGSWLRITYAAEGLAFNRKNAILKIERILNPAKKFPILFDIGKKSPIPFDIGKDF